MNYDKIFIIDANHYPLFDILEVDDIKYSYILAASDTAKNLLLDEHIFARENMNCKLVSTLPESVHAYLIGEFYQFFTMHRAKEVVIASRDRKFIQMIYCLTVLQPNLKRTLHPCCKEEDESNFEAEVIKDPESISSNKSLTRREQQIIDHLSLYPNGLKLKTLSFHYGLTKEKMEEIMGKLVDRSYISKYMNSYYANNY